MTQQPDSASTPKLDIWIKNLFDCIDRRDAAGFAAFLTHDASFRFGNAPAVTGSAAIEAAVAGFFAALGGLSHRVTLSADLGEHVVCRGDTTYTRIDGSQVTVPFANVFEMQGGHVRDYQIYADLTPLWNPGEA